MHNSLEDGCKRPMVLDLYRTNTETAVPLAVRTLREHSCIMTCLATNGTLIEIVKG